MVQFCTAEHIEIAADYVRVATGKIAIGLEKHVEWNASKRARLSAFVRITFSP